MNCDEYIRDFVSAHADGELSGEDLRAAEEHTAACARCREGLAEERALKLAVRQAGASVAAPDALRARISAALDAEEAAGHETAPRRRALPWPRRPMVWIPAALTALILLALVADRGRNSAEARVPAFDAAITHLKKFRDNFEPNVPSDTTAHVSEAYAAHGMPSHVWDFSKAGYRMVGGRVDRMRDGRPATFTLYRSRTDVILCTYVEIAVFAPRIKPAAHEDAHVFYRYRGYSVCVTKLSKASFYCILISHRPMSEMVQVIAKGL